MAALLVARPSMWGQANGIARSHGCQHNNRIQFYNVEKSIRSLSLGQNCVRCSSPTLYTTQSNNPYKHHTHKECTNGMDREKKVIHIMFGCVSQCHQHKINVLVLLCVWIIRWARLTQIKPCEPVRMARREAGPTAEARRGEGT